MMVFSAIAAPLLLPGQDEERNASPPREELACHPGDPQRSDEDRPVLVTGFLFTGPALIVPLPPANLRGLVYPNSQKSPILKDLGYFSIIK